MYKILITGGSGFVGKAFKESFQNNYNVVTPSRNELYNTNIFDDIDVVIHLAAISHDISYSSNNEIYKLYNTDLTNLLFDNFLKSDSRVFIFMSSILALKSTSEIPLTEDMLPMPESVYAKSKFESELFILNANIPSGKRVYILRTPLVYGIGNKGNLPLLIDFIKKIPFWPFGSYSTLKSFCDIRNLIFVVNKLIQQNHISNGIYHIADEYQYNLNELYSIITEYYNRKPRIFRISKLLIFITCFLGTIFHLSFNLNRLRKISNSLLVSNYKIKNAINSDLPFGGINDLLRIMPYL
jgi:nucleoside-diphosphate-sugar epimerase